MSSGHNWLAARGFTNYKIEHKFGTSFEPLVAGGAAVSVDIEFLLVNDRS